MSAVTPQIYNELQGFKGPKINGPEKVDLRIAYETTVKGKLVGRAFGTKVTVSLNSHFPHRTIESYSSSVERFFSKSFKALHTSSKDPAYYPAQQWAKESTDVANSSTTLPVDVLRDMDILRKMKTDAFTAQLYLEYDQLKTFLHLENDKPDDKIANHNLFLRVIEQTAGFDIVKAKKILNGYMLLEKADEYSRNLHNNLPKDFRVIMVSDDTLGYASLCRTLQTAYNSNNVGEVESVKDLILGQLNRDKL